MAKTKTPFLSLGSQGSVAGSITSQKRGSATLIREKPIPTDPYSLPQAYQRWLYEDYAYLWTLQDIATKQFYATAGSRHHLTGFQYFMRYHLTNLPDIIGLWHLDQVSAGVTPDSSRNLYHGTVFGSTPTPGRIDHGLFHDGINDYIDCGDKPTYEGMSAFTIEAFIRLDSIATSHALLAKIKAPTAGIYIWQLAGSTKLYLELQTDVAWQFVWLDALIPGQIQYIAAIYTGAQIFICIDDNESAPKALTGNVTTPIRDLTLGIEQWGAPSKHWHGLIDHAVFLDRALDLTERHRHSQRRYPA